MRIRPKSRRAALAAHLVESLQKRFVSALEFISKRMGGDAFEQVSWLRDGGTHGGGERYVAAETPVFDRASVNVSAVHYDDSPDRSLASATALSAIIHPAHPRAPSFHTHISWTEMRDGSGYWRLMADLNPSIEDAAARDRFAAVFERLAPAQVESARAQGDAYFYIPALERHRGVIHFYLESYSSGDFEVDRTLAQTFGEGVIDAYIYEVDHALATSDEPTDEERRAQLEYHTLYFLQVLTLDRGTTSGLLVHDQNDVGILASLPSHVDRELLESWAERLPAPQDQLLRALVAVLPPGNPSHVDDAARARLAAVVRAHYRAHPDAIDLQASSGVVPPTVANHQSP